MSRGRNRFLLLSLTVCIIIVVGCHDKDPAPATCRPHALLYDTDSIVYTYTDDRITLIDYFGSGVKINKDELEYTSAGQLLSLSKYQLTVDGNFGLGIYHELTYSTDGHPSKLVTDSYNGHFETKFTHGDLGELRSAETVFGSYKTFLGSTRYEYNDDGNVPKIYYTLNILGTNKEVLARENHTFDGKLKFYQNVPELKIINEYIYGYLPTKNNCLSSTVYYYNYTQHFTTPLDISFIASYDDEGQITSLQSDAPNTRLYSGDVLFNEARYRCR